MGFGFFLAPQNIWHLYFCVFHSFYILLLSKEDALDNGGGKSYPL